MFNIDELLPSIALPYNMERYEVESSGKPESDSGFACEITNAKFCFYPIKDTDIISPDTFKRDIINDMKLVHITSELSADSDAVYVTNKDELLSAFINSMVKASCSIAIKCRMGTANVFTCGTSLFQMLMDGKFFEKNIVTPQKDGSFLALNSYKLKCATSLDKYDVFVAYYNDYPYPGRNGVINNDGKLYTTGDDSWRDFYKLISFKFDDDKVLSMLK